jgi:hypothetical protein
MARLISAVEMRSKSPSLMRYQTAYEPSTRREMSTCPYLPRTGWLLSGIVFNAQDLGLIGLGPVYTTQELMESGL